MSDWFFPLLGGGEEQGLNESGIQTFKKASALGRETCQNIGDVRDGSGEPAIATFELIYLPIEEFPGLEQFKSCFESCQEYVLRDLKDGTGNEKEFFRNGMELLSSQVIPVLRIGDENTTGLIGSDVDRTQPFFRLLKQQGSSSSQGVGGGTYGIGQRAPFAHSALRTIFYSTRTKNGVAFTAKSILASFPHPDNGEITQAKGWWCNQEDDGKSWHTIRNDDSIPERFTRDKIGTDIWVVGFQNDSWEKTIRHSVLENFFAAIANDQLVVQLKKEGDLISRISSENLGEELKKAADEARQEQSASEYSNGLGATLYFYKALYSPLNGKPFETDISAIGNIKLYLYRDVDNRDLPDRWAKMRSPRIIVQHHGSRLLNKFAGVLICDNEKGNKYLAQLEGATHETWDVEETRNWSVQQKQEAKRVLNSITDFVRKTLKEVRGENLKDEEDVPFLGRYLPSEDDDNSNLTQFGSDLKPVDSDEESGERRNKVKKPVVKVSAVKLPRPSAAELEEQDSGGKSKRPKNKKRKKGNSKGRNGGGTNGGNTEGNEKKRKIFSPSEVNFRSFVIGSSYKIVLSSNKDITGILQLKAIGEDANYSISIIKALSLESSENLLVKGDSILEVSLIKNQKTTLLVDVDSDTELCLSMGE